MEGKIQVNSGDVSIIAVKVDNQDVTSIPQKGAGKSFQKAECTNDAIGNWNNANWEFRIQKLTKTKTKCTLYFVTGEVTGEQSVENKMEELLDKEGISNSKVSVVKDDFDNIRFIGTSPNNYVTFNGEDWRIIGLMNGIQTTTNGTQKLLKIIRYSSLGEYNWDKSSSSLNNGDGINEWSQADLMYALKIYGGDATQTTCGDSECPKWTPLTSEAQKMVEEVVWNTGTAKGTESVWQKQNYTLQQYMWERSSGIGKQCTPVGDTAKFCNENVNRQTTWTGKVGLMYPSDFGYATDGGGDLIQRGQCLYMPLYNWYYHENCYKISWLYDYSKAIWTMTAAPHSVNSVLVFTIASGGGIGTGGTYANNLVSPVVYLKSSVKITGGNGTSGNPYILSQ